MWFAANCSIEVLAYGLSITSPNNGFVKLNKVSVWVTTGTHLRNVNTLLVDPFTCRLQQRRHFDTYDTGATAAAELKNYLQQLDHGSIIVAATADEPSRHLATALSTLRQFGADVSDVQIRGSFGFVAQKGYPSKTVLRKVLTEAESATDQSHFKVLIRGML